MEQHSVNKAIIRDFYRRVMGQGDMAFAEEIIADAYIQHSPMGKPGKAGLLEALAAFKQMPKPVVTSKPFMRLIAEGEYVVTNICFDWGGVQKVVVDLFRFQHGQVIEHWDVVQDQPEISRNGHSRNGNSRNGNAMMDGPVDADRDEPTEPNKTLIAAYYQHIWIDRQVDQLAAYVAVDLIQHDPDIANGIAGLRAYLHQESMAIKTVHRIIGDGNFVVVQASGELTGKPTVFYDILRLSAGKITEQWRVHQAIPDKMEHTNGMI
ncbi:nuclear transport factor 2 family protein [Spirosoma agri]|uniref:SnoaL-like domain-containing protein n=1 Tax=Spirosoma agri TaxID=1987381 RepID=A0A6M0IHK0_9BACT|nr:nuclear transport factor 2 family protein [Spirosoma agri]NEU67654.1 hypothetical protein [Spirosoma agri]